MSSVLGHSTSTLTVLTNTTWKRDAIECVDDLTNQSESDVEFVLVVLAASTTLIA